MDLINKTVSKYLTLSASSSPAPGGGSAAALQGAIGASLIAMTASLTRGKKKYTHRDGEMETIAAEVEGIMRKLAVLVNRDSGAFSAVSDVFAMPKDSDEEKARRGEAMEKALKGCVETPLETMAASLKALGLAKKIIANDYNTNASSDLGSAASSLRTALQAARLNVLINLTSIKDAAFVSEKRDMAEKIFREGIALADDIYQKIEAALIR
ncbi:MAG: cyclodeaminase/cyclohydrolase family protein [Treponema sp.]|jgi:formiminotetrahydrofolate cyclodeaminase|nr:cyclodeaminase/cyclohydrolase family protein [Treponema sp.]